MISYSVGYAVGYISSLILNNIFTFKEYKNKFNMQYYVKFTFFFLIAFLLSKIFVFMAVEVFSLSVYIGFLIGMLMYTFSSYLMFKKYVYKGSAQ
jgi:putative flippase GtrA